MSKLKKVIFEYEDKTLSASDFQAEKWQQNFTEMLGWADCENNNKFVGNPVAFEVGEVSDSSTATAIEIEELKEKYIATIEELQEDIIDQIEKYEALQKKFDALVQEAVIIPQQPIPVEPVKLSETPVPEKLPAAKKK